MGQGLSVMVDPMAAGSLVVVSDPLPFAWGAVARAATSGALVVVTTDLSLDARHDDPRDAFAALGDHVVGPGSGGARRGEGTFAVVTRLGAGFAHAVEGLEVREAIDLGSGWGLDEAALVARWIDAGVARIGLVAPRPSARLAHALALARGRVVVLDPAGRDWSAHGAAAVTSLAALRLALTLPESAGGADPPALVGTSGPALEAVRAALEARGIGVRPASEQAAARIAQEVHARAALGAVNDLTVAATPRHVAYVTDALLAEGPVLMVDGAMAADAGALAEALRARRALHGEEPADLVPPPEADLARAQALLAAAMLSRRTTLERDQALAIAAAIGLGRPAPSLPVGNLGAAREATRSLARRSDDRAFIGAVGLPSTPVVDLERDWDALVAALASVDPWAARWIAVAPDGAPFTLTIVHGPVGPVARWDLRDASGAVTLPARAGAAPLELPATLLGAASAAVLMLSDLASLEVRGVIRDGAATLVDARATIATSQEA
ncbi:MAG: hypothetical protein IT385_29860 [Deltaproteobacteria bacterium]|nr:hypothetical protein [Deltaproteobacteria bacterium]